MEIVNLRVIGRARIEASATSWPEPNGHVEPRTVRPAYFGPQHGLCETPVLRRQHLPIQPLAGPLIVEEYDATVVVPPGCTAARDRLGNIIIQLEP
jgi:N-methylhydantoinase A